MSIKIVMETIEVRHIETRRFPHSKTVGGRLCFRITQYRRGRKFIIWMPWTLETMQPLHAYHSLDLEDELNRRYMEAIASVV